MKQKDAPFLEAMCEASPPTNFGVVTRDPTNTPCEGGINVSHAMGQSAYTQAESYYIRIVFAGQDCWVKDLIWELQFGPVGDMWLRYESRPFCEYEPQSKKWKECRKGLVERFIRMVLTERLKRCCRKCNGTGYTGRMIGGRVDGQYHTKKVIPMQCQVCNGEGIKRYSADERAHKVGMPPAMYNRHWHQFAEDIDALFERYEDEVARKGKHWMWSWGCSGE